MPWDKQKTSWIGLAMMGASDGGWIDGALNVEQLFGGMIAGLAFIVLQGAQVGKTP